MELCVDIVKTAPLKNDKLGLSTFLRNWVEGINSSKDNVFGLSGPWGCGKTTFLKILEFELINRHYKVSYFSAWEADWFGDPLVSIYSEIEEVFLSNEGVTESIKDTTRVLIEKLISKSIPSLVSGLLKSVLQMFSSGVLDKSTMEDFLESINSHKFSSINLYQEEKTARRKLIAQLQEIAIIAKGKSDHRPVILIDELDRCQPDYAIRLLESIKHIFSRTDFVFVLAYNREQINTSIRHAYGNDTKADEYIHKLIQQEIEFPTTSSWYYFQHLKTDRYSQEALEEIGAMNEIFAIMPRIQNRIMFKLNSIARLHGERTGILYLMCYLKILNPQNIVTLSSTNIETACELVLKSISDSWKYDRLESSCYRKVEILSKIFGELFINYGQDQPQIQIGHTDLTSALFRLAKEYRDSRRNLSTVIHEFSMLLT